MSSSQPELHVVFGAGQVGALLAGKLAARGHQVRMVSRREPPHRPAGVAWVRGDLTDASLGREITRGARAVYHCANPMRYDQWEQLLPPLSKAILEAVSGSGARLVVLDNLYMYGTPRDGLIRRDTPEQPESKKGELRAALGRQFFAAQARGDVEVSIGRASDFFGPRSDRTVTFHPLFFKQLRRGQRSPVLGDPDLPHAYAYMVDMAEALLRLGTQPQASDLPWLLPHSWNGTTRALFDLFGRLAGRKVTPWRVPAWLWPVAGLWDPELKAVREMLHEWNNPFTVDDTDFRRAFAMHPTPIEQAAQETLQAFGLAPKTQPSLQPA